jgi:hypothetical protein
MSNLITTKTGQTAPTLEDLADRQLGVDVQGKGIYIRHGNEVSKVGDAYDGTGAVRYDIEQSLTSAEQQRVATAIGVGNLDANFAEAFQTALAASQNPTPVSFIAAAVGFDATGQKVQFNNLQEAVAYLLSHMGTGGGGSMALNETVITESTIWTAPADGAVKLVAVGGGGDADTTGVVETTASLITINGVVMSAVAGGSGAMATDTLTVQAGDQLVFEVGGPGMTTTVTGPDNYWLKAAGGRAYHAGGCCAGGTTLAEYNLGMDAAEPRTFGDGYSTYGIGAKAPHPLSEGGPNATSSGLASTGVFGGGGTNYTYQSASVGGNGFATLAFYKDEVVDYAYDEATQAFLTDPEITATSLESWLTTTENPDKFRKFLKTYRASTLMESSAGVASVLSSSTASNLLFSSPSGVAALLASTTALSILIQTPSLLGVLAGTEAGLAGLAASPQGLSTLFADSACCAVLLGTPATLLAFYRSRSAWTAMLNSTPAMTYIFQNTTLRTWFLEYRVRMYNRSLASPTAMAGMATTGGAISALNSKLGGNDSLPTIYTNTAARKALFDSVAAIQWMAALGNGGYATYWAIPICFNGSDNNNPPNRTYPGTLDAFLASNVALDTVCLSATNKAFASALCSVTNTTNLFLTALKASETLCRKVLFSEAGYTRFIAATGAAGLFKTKAMVDEALASAAVMAQMTVNNLSYLESAVVSPGGYRSATNPRMTSATTPSGKVTASSVASSYSSYQAWNAFSGQDYNSVSYWRADYTAANGTQWLEYEFANATSILRATVQLQANATANAFSAVLQYYNGGDWVTVSPSVTLFSDGSINQLIANLGPVATATRWRVLFTNLLTSNQYLYVANVVFSGFR